MAACLSGLAGFVDAIGFLQLGGFFVSFMSGNSTRLAVGISNNLHNAGVAAGLILAFVIGVMTGSIAGHYSRSRRTPVVLLAVTLLLIIAASLAMFGQVGAAAAVMAMAMGAENAVFERDGDVHIGLTYMTGTLVKFGQRLSAAFLGGDRSAWVPYLLLWLGLVAGAVVGAFVFSRIGAMAIWGAAAWALLLTIVNRAR